METAGSGARGIQRFVVTAAEREVADLLPIEVAPELARATVRGVPFWFHTFALNRAEGIYTPGADVGALRPCVVESMLAQTTPHRRLLMRGWPVPFPCAGCGEPTGWGR